MIVRNNGKVGEGERAVLTLGYGQTLDTRTLTMTFHILDLPELIYNHPFGLYLNKETCSMMDS